MPTVTLGGSALVERAAFRNLGGMAQVQGAPTKTLGANALVATDVASKILGANALVAAEAQKTLGAYALVEGDTGRTLFGFALVSREETKSLGGNAMVAPGKVLNASALVSRMESALLGGSALVAAAGSTPPPVAGVVPGWNPRRFFPDDNRNYAQWSPRLLSANEIASLVGQEGTYLQAIYRNYPNPAGKSDVAWFWGGTYLPVNGIDFKIEEPTRQTRIDPPTGRTLVISLEESDTPRITRARKFSFTFPPVGIQMVQFLKSRMRNGTQFYAEFHLLDPKDDEWETIYTDTSDADRRYLDYYGVLPAWKPGYTTIRENGSVLGSGYAVDHALGKVSFSVARDPGAEIQAQWIYRPRVQVVSVEAEPQGGTQINRFRCVVNLQEVGA